MAGNHVNLIKLSVGSEGVETLAEWQKMRATERPDGLPCHVTRMWPKREADVLAGGSIYWVIKGAILCRQRVLKLDEVIGGDGIRRCAIVLDPKLVRTVPTPRRPFQGWRYLPQDQTPPDLTAARSKEDSLPPELTAALAEIGVL